MHNRCSHIIIVALVALLATGCFTGVESTKKIDDKEVRRAMQELERDKPPSSLGIIPAPLAEWHNGKRFCVIDSQAAMIFTPTARVNPDTLHLTGKEITYLGRRPRRQFDNREVVDLLFLSGSDTLHYNTGKTEAQLSTTVTQVPFLVDCDVISEYAQKLTGKSVYVKTSLWYDLNGDMTGGKKFVPVTITAVEAGNKVFPLKVIFTPSTGTPQQAMLWMTLDNSTIASRDFDSLFSFGDVRLKYPNITDATWHRIVDGTVATGMTKEECRLSLGSPKNVIQRPDQTGLREYWYYDGGRYLVFVDGLLNEYR